MLSVQEIQYMCERVWWGVVLAAMALLAGGVVQAQSAPTEQATRQRFAVYYAARDDAALSRYDVLVLDADEHPSIAGIRARSQRHQLILGYVALCEIGAGRPYRADLVRQHLLLGQNPKWPGTFFIDIRSDAWRRRVIGQIIPSLIAQGFDGVFLDTVDDAVWLETDAPQALRRPGMIDAAVTFVHAIRVAFPGRPLMLNRGFTLLSRVAPDVDMVLAESIYSQWGGANRSTFRLPPEVHAGFVRELEAARALHAGLGIYTLDYWEPADHAGVARIYAAQRTHGFVPYVSTRDLNAIIPEPSE
jgi:uncharacterized protein (TIGR01370 family)